MRLIKFPGHNVVFAENQPEYLPLPALLNRSPEGELICCWELTWRERLQVLFGGRIWHSVLTFNHPLQPQMLATEKPEAVRVAEGQV